MIGKVTGYILCATLLGTLTLGETACSRKQTGTQSTAAATTPTDASSIALNNRGVGLMGRFDYKAAHDVFESLITQHPDWLDAKVNLAIATFNRQQVGDEDRGMILLREVLSADPDHLRAMYCTGILLQIRGQMDEAGALFEKVAQADPADAYAAYFVGLCVEVADPKSALKWYEQAIRRDPYLRSAYYRSFQILQQLGRKDEARSSFDAFRKFEKNPRANLVEIKYSRMGPKANVTTVDAPTTSRPPKLQGPLFADPVPLLTNGDGLTWKSHDPRNLRRPSITACDLDRDGDIDLFITGALVSDGLHNAVCINNGDGTFTLDRNHTLATIANVNAALWGDFDNDGMTDVYLCRQGPNILFRLDADSAWKDVTASTGTDNGQFDTVDGAMFDADHDGDLDIFCVNADGPNELLNNNLNGTFVPIAKQQGIAGDGRASRQILPVDLDVDRDTDIIVVNEEPPHEIYLNDRLWTYNAVSDMDAVQQAQVVSLLASDRDVDGTVELYGCRSDGRLIGWARDADNQWKTTLNQTAQVGDHDAADYKLALMDTNGDGARQILRAGVDGLVTDDDSHIVIEGWHSIPPWAPVNLNPATGPAVVVQRSGEPPSILRPGPARHAFASFTFSGRTADADSMRSNASGIGTRLAVRIGSRWTSVDTFRITTGPGQSLQPVAIGLGGADTIDFVALDWSDGVYQTELDLQGGSLHHVTETQRQLSSCPVLFAFNGEKFEFVSDVLGVGGIGYMVAPHEYAPPRPWEKFLFPPGSIAPHNGRYMIKIMEPMEEACYLDAASLDVWDLPPGWHMTLDERMNIAGTDPTGDPIFYRDEFMPIRAVNDRNDDVLATITIADHHAAPVGRIDERFIGRLVQPHTLTLDFDQTLDDLDGAPVLIIDGWVEYPYSQTMFSAWQAGAAYDAPTLEARDERGQWRTIAEQFGYPAGMPRRMALPLPDLPEGTRALRLSTNMEIYWDRIAVAAARPCPEVVQTSLPPFSARLGQTGFPKRTTGNQRLPQYDYDNRAPLWDTKWQAGWYTSVGEMMALVEKADAALAIFGPGDEIHIEFESTADDPPKGWTRRIVLDVRGWCKDMDLFTRDGETVEPLPGRSEVGPTSRAPAQLLNARFRSGR